MSAVLTTNVDKRLLQTTKFPPEFNVKVDMTKVNLPVIKTWVTQEITRIMNGDDDIVTELVFNLIEGTRYPNVKELQIALNGFLDKDAPKFSQNLWKLCISAQENPQGIPKELLEAKKMQLIQERLEEDRIREEARKRQETEREREAEIARVRDRERSERGRGREGRYGRDSDRRPPRRDSRSPPPPRRRRDDDDSYRAAPSRGTDSYVPSRARRDERPPRRRSRSLSRSPSRSRSPPKRRRRYSSSPSRSPPPRRRRATSSERSLSRDRGKGKRGERRRSRSIVRRRSRSRSPRRRRDPDRRRSRSHSNDSRSPPPKRTRRASRSRSPPRKRTSLAKDDLMSPAQNKRRNEPRLSRESSPEERPKQRRRRNTSSVESNDRDTTNAGAQESGFSFVGAASQQAAPSPRPALGAMPANTPAPTQDRAAEMRRNELRMQLLKQKYLAEKAARAGPIHANLAAPQ